MFSTAANHQRAQRYSVTIALLAPRASAELDGAARLAGTLETISGVPVASLR
jgi:hypothetical protein